MKKPVKNPPSSVTGEAGSSSETSTPALQPVESVSFSESSEQVPTLMPPVSLSSDENSDDAFGAGVWVNDKRINALFSTNETRNSWMGVTGVGWVKLANTIDSANEALTVLVTAAKVKNSPVNYYLDNGQVTQIYVW